jgi:DNA invertase Pin-like site-specific DNA recombinase
MKLTRTVAIYARVSTFEQNPESQLEALREYVQRREFSIAGEYVDQITGAIQKRKKPGETAYRELMDDAMAMKFDCVLVWKFDRFARSLPALLDALNTFNALGIDFISITQQIDTTTPMGRLFFSMVGAFAEFERELICERVRSGIANAKRKGVIMGRPRDLSVEWKVYKLKQAGMGIRAISREVKRSASNVIQILTRIKARERPGAPSIDDAMECGMPELAVLGTANEQLPEGSAPAGGKIQ